MVPKQVEMDCILFSCGPLSPSYTVLPKQNGRVAIVTGGTRGMGFETARHLASLGMHVVIGRLLSNHMPEARFYTGPCFSLQINTSLCSPALTEQFIRCGQNFRLEYLKFKMILHHQSVKKQQC